MARVSNLSPLWLRANAIDKAVALFSKDAPRAYRQFVNMVETRDQYFQLATYTDLPAAEPRTEGTNMPFIDISTPYYVKAVPTPYSMGFEISNEALKRDQYGIFKRVGTGIGQTIEKAQDILCASFINLATTNSVLAPDGLSLANAAHPNDVGTFSNILTGNLPLSYAGITNMAQMIRSTKSQIGDPMSFGPLLAIVPETLEIYADQLFNTNGISGTNDRDINAAGKMYAGYVVNRRLTSPTAWAAVAKEQNPLHLVSGSATEIGAFEDGRANTSYYTANKLLALLVSDARGFGYSAGA